MTVPCPLPIDWLDHLQGDAPDMEAHLRSCSSCRVVVKQLKDSGIVAADTDWARQFSGRLDGVWNDTRSAPPQQGEFWFSAPDFEFKDFRYHGADRIVVLVLNDAQFDNAADLSWLDVTPVLSDVERATETDLLFTAEESDLGSPWRAVFSAQSKVERRQLDSRIGALTAAGFELLLSALMGSAPSERWGTPLEGPADPRIWIEPSLEQALIRLRTPYLLWLESAPAVPEAHPPGSLSVHAGTEQTELTGQIIPLRRVKAPPQRTALAAADKPNPAREHWELTAGLLKLHGELFYRWGEPLAFRVTWVEEQRDVPAVRLWLSTKQGRRIRTEPFHARVDLRVTLPVKDVTDKDISEVEAEVVE